MQLFRECVSLRNRLVGFTPVSLLLSFSFILNRHHTSWISSSRSVRQGDHISPILFLLLSQNQSMILNKALNLNLIPGFNNSLPKIFNHLMFVDDLIIITPAFRKIAINCLVWLDLYRNITGRKENLKKYEIFLPSWCNWKITLTISRILGFTQGSSPSYT